MHMVGDFRDLLDLAATGSGVLPDEEERPLTPVELVIRTKWSGAQVRWIGERHHEL